MDELDAIKPKKFYIDLQIEKQIVLMNIRGDRGEPDYKLRPF